MQREATRDPLEGWEWRYQDDRNLYQFPQWELWHQGGRVAYVTDGASHNKDSIAIIGHRNMPGAKHAKPLPSGWSRQGCVDFRHTTDAQAGRELVEDYLRQVGAWTGDNASAEPVGMAQHLERRLAETRNELEQAKSECDRVTTELEQAKGELDRVTTELEQLRASKCRRCGVPLREPETAPAPKSTVVERFLLIELV